MPQKTTFDVLWKLALKKCTHQEITIIEYGTSFTEHNREKDGNWQNYSSVGSYTGTVEIKCSECGMARIINKKKAPKWLKKYFEELGI